MRLFKGPYKALHRGVQAWTSGVGIAAGSEASEFCRCSSFMSSSQVDLVTVVIVCLTDIATGTLDVAG